jgi:NAD(P)H-hydrate repair Nnr-like enzyme with NAD(P)H-hydrate dehydratase domain
LATAAGRSAATVVAVDLPSGVDADTGVVAGTAVRADVTVTFGTWKPGLLIDPGATYAGVTELVDIGLHPDAADVVSAQAADIAGLLPAPTADSDKYRRGVLGLISGSERYTGAAVLSAGGAIHGGAGMIRFVSAQPAVDVLVDADGLTILAEHRDLLRRSAPTLITPHAGELSRLTGADRADIEAGRLTHARAAARSLGVTVLLKGSTTVICSPPDSPWSGPDRVNSTGTPWLATAGSGDVLSGLAGALLAQGLNPPDAAAAAAFLHGVAARQAADGAPIGASDVVRALPGAIRSVQSS